MFNLVEYSDIFQYPLVSHAATSFLNRFLITVQGEEDKTMEDVMKIFASLHEMELAHVANQVTEKDYITSDHFEAYLVSTISTSFVCKRISLTSYFIGIKS